MKKIIIILLCLFMTGCNAFTSDFEDRNLKVGIERALRLQGLSNKDYDQLTHLDLSFLGIQSLEGIEALEQLESLDLSDNMILDISQLSGMKHLEILDLQNNQIEDLTPLQDASELSVLLIRNNPIESIQPLEGLIGQLKTTDFLTEIEFNDDAFETYLRTSIGKDEQITYYDLERIKRIDLRETQVKDITGIGFAKNLEQLIIDSPVDGLKEIASLDNLKQLVIQNNKISNLSFIKGLTKLKHLDLSNNKIKSIEALENLVSLSYLNLKQNQIEDVAIINRLDQLEELYLFGNYISSYDAVADILDQVEKTDVFIVYFEDANLDHAIRAQLDKLEGVVTQKELKRITSLSVSNNGITSLGGIELLENLVELDVSYNDLSDLEDLKGLDHLKILKAAHNEIKDVSTLKYLYDLNILDLSDNLLTNVDDLLFLNHLEYLLLSGNVIETNSMTEEIKSKVKYTDEW